MDDDINYRHKQWQPPARPEWVQRLNDESAHLESDIIVPLDENSLIDTAKSHTGLADFGAEDWYEPFKAFVKSINEEARLNFTGRMMTRLDILMYLEARLRVEDAYKRHPEIDEEEIVAPILIMGAGRSGTSALQILMSQDPGSGTLTQWEGQFPAPPPEAATYRSDPRIAKADRVAAWWNHVMPDFMSMHELGGLVPTELAQLECISFQSGVNWLIWCGFTPGFHTFMAGRSRVPGVAYGKRVLKLLQWKNPRQRWLLKNPDSINYLPETFEVYPDIRMVWAHRDPLKTVSSIVSFIGTILWARSDQKLNENAVANLTNPAGAAAMFDVVMDQMDQGVIPASQFHHAQYLDFVADPMATVEKLYAEMRIPLTDAARKAMKNHLEANPREKRPAHNYQVNVAARANEERKLFARYQARFGVSSEV